MAGVIKQEDITTSVREVDFVTQFGKNWDALREVMGIARPIRKTPGTKLTSYLTSLTLEDGAVEEAGTIPFSHATITPVAYDDVNILKYAKSVSLEAVAKYGADVAVTRTDEEFRNELQSKVLLDFYTFLKTGSLTDTEDTWQMAFAMAQGLVRDKFKRLRRDVTDVVQFVNILDVYEYLGSKDVTVQTQGGMTYLQNFMGARSVIMTSDIARGTVIATPVNNIDLYYIDPSDSNFAQLGLPFTVQGETNLIGFHTEGKYSNMTGESYALMGMKLWAEYIDGIAVVTVGDSPSPIITPSVTLDKTTATIESIGDTLDLTATTVPAGETVTWSSNDATVATVSDGTVTAVKAGEATITATITVDGEDYTDTCTVTVSGE